VAAGATTIAHDDESLADADNFPPILSDYDLYLLGVAAKNKMTAAGATEAIGLLQNSLALDPGFAGAWTARVAGGGSGTVRYTELEAAALQSYPRSVSLEDRFAELLPEVMIGVDAQAFAEIAAAAMTPRPVPTVGTGHLHHSKVSVPEQARRVLALLESRGVGHWASFSDLVAECTMPIEIVGSFLALLELYRARAITFEQPEPLGVLKISWTGGNPTADELHDDELDADPVEEQDQP